MDIIYHFLPTTWKNKMIEQSFHYADSTVKEMSDFFETRVENLEFKEEKKNLQQVSRNLTTRKVPRSINKKTLTPVS